MEHDLETFSLTNAFINHQKGRSSSPINFFQPNMKKFPYWKDINKFRTDMEKGDCIFIPAYNYYQFKAEHLSPGQQAKRLDHKVYRHINNFNSDYKRPVDPKEVYVTLDDIHLATVVSFKYEGNSDLLAGIYEAVEMGIIN